MKKSTVLPCVITVVAGLLVMCLFSTFLPPAYSSLIGYLIYICMAGLIAFFVARNRAPQRAKKIASCVALGLFGIEVMHICSERLSGSFSGYAGFAVFLIFAAIIVAILPHRKETQ